MVTLDPRSRDVEQAAVEDVQPQRSGRLRFGGWNGPSGLAREARETENQDEERRSNRSFQLQLPIWCRDIGAGDVRHTLGAAVSHHEPQFAVHDLYDAIDA